MDISKLGIIPGITGGITEATKGLNIDWDEAGKAAAAAATTFGPTLINKAIQNRGAYPQCGSRPIFPGRRRRDYETCVANAINMQQQARNASTTPQDFLKNATPILLIAGVLAGIYFYNKKK
jgi:hypothetical protein